MLEKPHQNDAETMMTTMVHPRGSVRYHAPHPWRRLNTDWRRDRREDIARMKTRVTKSADTLGIDEALHQHRDPVLDPVLAHGDGLGLLRQLLLH